MRKLEAIALYYRAKSSHNIYEIDNLLKDAIKKFDFLKIYHGIAVCNFARAFILFHKRFLIANNKQASQKELDVVQEASKACSKGLEFYQKIKHLYGQSESLRL